MSTQPMPPVWPMYRSLVGVGVLCGLLIAVVFQGTRPVIERNRAEALERAVFAVLPAASQRVTYGIVDGERFQAAPDAITARVHAGYNDAGRLVGIAIEAAGMGYADTISVLYGYSPEQEAVVGIRILTSKETPGLGDRIESDPAFLANFVALDARLDGSGSAIAQPITTVKQGTKTESWQIDGITGATISSVAIGDILATSTAQWVPLLKARLQDFEQGGGDGGS